MELEPGMVDQVADFVKGWDIEVLDAITGRLTAGEADLLARVFGAHGGMDDALLVMVSFMAKTQEDSTERIDWAYDAARVSDLGWFDDAEAWNDAALAAYGSGALVVTHANMLALVELWNSTEAGGV